MKFIIILAFLASAFCQPTPPKEKLTCDKVEIVKDFDWKDAESKKVLYFYANFENDTLPDLKQCLTATFKSITDHISDGHFTFYYKYNSRLESTGKEVRRTTTIYIEVKKIDDGMWNLWIPETSYNLNVTLRVYNEDPYYFCWSSCNNLQEVPVTEDVVECLAETQEGIDHFKENHQDIADNGWFRDCSFETPEVF